MRDRYLPHIQTSKRRPDFDEGLLRLHLLPAFGSYRLAEIEGERIQAWLTRKQQAGLSPAYCNAMAGVLRRIYNLAKRWNIPGADRNPTANVTLFEVHNIKEVYLTPEQTERLIAAVKANRNTQLRYIVPLLLLTGARKRELLDSRWQDFDLDRREWRIPMTKSASPARCRSPRQPLRCWRRCRGSMTARMSCRTPRPEALQVNLGQLDLSQGSGGIAGPSAA